MNPIIVANVHFVICLPTKKILAITNPKKNDQIKMGLCSISHFMLLTKDNNTNSNSR